ncbi:MAG TPA: DUF2510 domain-containing protein [Galbitalea sp.]
MTNSATPEHAVAGWYPTSPGSTQLRWWDGDQWTEHFHTVGLDAPATLTAPAGTSANTPWIWIIALLPLAQLAELPFLTHLYSVIFSAGFTNPSAISTIEFAPDSGYFALQGIGLLLYGVYVVLAVLDYRALKARGVPRPFHWAWTFLSALVYIIGRTVVVRRRTGKGMAPMWVNIVVIVVTIIATFAVVVPILTAAINAAVSSAG